MTILTYNEGFPYCKSQWFILPWKQTENKMAMFSILISQNICSVYYVKIYQRSNNPNPIEALSAIHKEIGTIVTFHDIIENNDELS